MPRAAAGTTRERILDAAEALFAEHGFGDASLRAITSEAGVNLAAVHYHFGSKQALIEVVFARRLDPLNAERLARLDALEAAGTPTLPQILEAFVGPPLRLYSDPQRGGPTFMRLMGRTLGASGPEVEEVFRRRFAETARRFSAALRRVLPELPAEDLFWRMHFAVGAMALTMCDTFRLDLISGGLCRNDDIEAVIRRLVAFLAGGIAAPLPAAPEDR